MNLRGALYWIARRMGDYNAIERGRFGARLIRSAMQRAAGRLINSIFR